MKKIISKLTNRVVFTALFMVVQIAFIVISIYSFQESSVLVYIGSVIISIVIVIYIINEDSNPAYKIAWILPILVLPVFGCLLYLMFGKNRLSINQRDKMLEIQKRYDKAMDVVDSALPGLRSEDADAAVQAEYLKNLADAPAFSYTDTEYLPTGEAVFASMLVELEKAERYIFLEYFIIDPGKMWNSILEILVRKVKQGVEVRVMYDDFGSIYTVPRGFDKKLGRLGIKCKVFHRFVPVLSGRFNNRDHRKICVIDGHTAYTGGINLADEYINEIERFGYWQDCGVMVKGAACWGFTVMFLTMWEYVTGKSEDYQTFLPDPYYVGVNSQRGYVIPYADNPLDGEQVGETAYLNMINKAKDYVYICTPYLIIGNEMITALTTAAKSGIDVRIITPHIPDKKTVFALTRSYYRVLLEAGVRIFEFTPGFIHSKTFVSDDKFAICGTVNMDFRSLYLHYECAVWMYKTDAVMPMKDSFLKIQDKSEEITPKWCKKRPLTAKLLSSLLRAFAPLA